VVLWCTAVSNLFVGAWKVRCDYVVYGLGPARLFIIRYGCCLHFSTHDNRLSGKDTLLSGCHVILFPALYPSYLTEKSK
jgi:hypothetical protein